MMKVFKFNRILTYVISRLISKSSSLIAVYERRYIEKYSKLPLKHQPVFIIGAPRTGSTFLYQTITNQNNVLYVDNLICLFHKNWFFGFWLSNKLFKQRVHNCFQSEQGNTGKYGLHAPSECGAFWYRWLPIDRHFIDFDELTGQDMREIKDVISAVSNYFDKPIVFKNLNAGQRMRMISEIFPDAKFIFVRRAPFFNAQSILMSKRKLGIPEDQFWSIKPSNFNELERLPWQDQVVQQIYYLENQIVGDAKYFNKGSLVEVYYSDFNQRTINMISTKLELVARKDCEPVDIFVNENIVIDKGEVKVLEKSIEKLDWSKLNVK